MKKIFSNIYQGHTLRGTAGERGLLDEKKKRYFTYLAMSNMSKGTSKDIVHIITN